jgi:hypothetical protein
MSYVNIPLGEKRGNYNNSNRAENAILVVVVAALAYFVGNKACENDPYLDHPTCDVKVEAGDTLTDILAKEGLRGEELRKAVDAVCRENSERLMPGGRYDMPVFVLGEGSDDCSVMMANAVISVPDINNDRKANGHRCEQGSY